MTPPPPPPPPPHYFYNYMAIKAFQQLPKYKKHTIPSGSSADYAFSQGAGREERERERWGSNSRADVIARRTHYVQSIRD